MLNKICDIILIYSNLELFLIVEYVNATLINIL